MSDTWVDPEKVVRNDPDLHNEEFNEHLIVDTDQRTDPQGLVNSITEDTQSMPHSFEYEAVARTAEQQAIAGQVEEERLFQVNEDRDVDTVNTNYSGQVRFQTYQLTGTMGPIKILDDKNFRGDSVIFVQSGGPLYISARPSQAGNPDTAQITSGMARTIRTRNDLYAVVGTGISCTFDVQEEFGS